jgi:hypothetical protein
MASESGSAPHHPLMTNAPPMDGLFTPMDAGTAVIPPIGAARLRRQCIATLASRHPLHLLSLYRRHKRGVFHFSCGVVCWRWPIRDAVAFEEAIDWLPVIDPAARWEDAVAIAVLVSATSGF